MLYMAISMEKIIRVILVAPVFETSLCDQHMASIGNIWGDVPVIPCPSEFCNDFFQKGPVVNMPGSLMPMNILIQQRNNRPWAIGISAKL